MKNKITGRPGKVLGDHHFQEVMAKDSGDFTLPVITLAEAKAKDNDQWARAISASSTSKARKARKAKVSDQKADHTATDRCMLHSQVPAQQQHQLKKIKEHLDMFPLLKEMTRHKNDAEK